MHGTKMRIGLHLLQAMVLLSISCCNGNIVEQAEAHGLGGSGVVAWRAGNGVAGWYLPARAALLGGLHHSIHQCQCST